MASGRMPSSKICCSTRARARVNTEFVDINALVEESLQSRLAWGAGQSRASISP